MEIDAIRNKRNARLRRKALRLLDGAKAAGGLRGRWILDALESTGEAPDDADAMLGLLRDLANAGHVVETDVRKYKHQRPGLDTILFAITARGTALLEEAIAPDPLIEDERLGR